MKGREGGCVREGKEKMKEGGFWEGKGVSGEGELLGSALGR